VSNDSPNRRPFDSAEALGDTLVSRTVQVNGATLHYVRAGAGGHPECDSGIAADVGPEPSNTPPQLHMAKPELFSAEHGVRCSRGVLESGTPPR
jgi:hypothetical protein